MSVLSEKFIYCRKAYIERGETLSSLARSLDIKESSLRKLADDEHWRMQRARYLIAERHRIQVEEGIDFSRAAHPGPKSNELHDLCLTLFWQKNMKVTQIAKLTNVPVGTVRRWKAMECWDEQKVVLKEQGQETPPDHLRQHLEESETPDYREVIARHLFVKQRMTLETIHDITGIDLPALRELSERERWIDELAAYRVPVDTRSLTEELKNAAQSLQVFLVRECDSLARSNADRDPKLFDSFSRTIKSVQYMIGQFAFLNVSIIQDVVNGLTDYCIAEVSKSRMTIADMNTIFHIVRGYCDYELNAVAPNDLAYELSDDIVNSSSERDASPTSVPGRVATASATVSAADFGGDDE